MILLTVCAVASGCSTIGKDVPPPEGPFCSFYERGNKSLCVDIESGSKLPAVPASQMDKWITMPPRTWNSIQTTIDKLRNRVQDLALETYEASEEFFLETESFEPMGLSSDIKRVQDHTKRLYRKTLQQR